MSKYHNKYTKKRNAHYDIPNLTSNVYMGAGFWCPERLEKHRFPRYHAEIVLGKRTKYMNWIEFVVCTLKERTFCDYCKSFFLVNMSEQKVLTKELESRLLKLKAFEYEEEPLRIQRGVITELYYGEEYDEFGRSVSNDHYGHGSDLTEFQRIPYLDLEIINVLTNILNDNESDPTVVFEKRRYIQSFVEFIGNLSKLSDKLFVKQHYQNQDDFHYALHEVSWSLGFLVAEYNSKFSQELVRSKGLVNATRVRHRDGEKRRSASLKAGNQILKQKPELIVSLPKLARIIEESRLPEHKQRNGSQIGSEAIAIHLREALRLGKLKNS